MRRSPIRRGEKRLSRRSRLRTTNPTRRAKLRAEQFGPEGEWMRDLPCSTCTRRPPSEPSHVKTRGAGGKRQDLAPQCSECHRELHDVGVDTFQARRRGCDLVALAREYAAQWRGLPTSVRDHYTKIFNQRWPLAAAVLERETPP